MADNPLKHSDLVKDDGAIDELIDKLEKLNITYSDTLKTVRNDAIKLEASIVKVNSSTAEQRDVISQTAQEADKLTKAQQSYTQALSENQQQINSLREAQKALNKQKQLELKVVNSAEGSYDKLSAQYSLNKIRLNQMSKEQRKATKEGQALEKQTKEIRAEMNKLQKDTGNTSLEVGNYKQQVGEALAEQDLFGLNLKSLGGIFTTVTGAIGAGVAVVGGLFKAYTSSARGAEDLARASDRLDSVITQLGNSIADTFGDDGGILDGFFKAVQIRFLGIGSFVQSQLSVNARAALRELEVLEVENERIKKALLQEAEVFRQIRDEERNSAEQREEANANLAFTINEREQTAIDFQNQRLKQLKILLNLDKDNLEIQRAIKQVEFEIADIREESEGFRSEQLANDLALARENVENRLALEQARIREELIGLEDFTQKRIDLELRLINITKKLQLEAAGENKARISLAIQEARNAEKELFENVKKFEAQKKVERDKQLEIDKKRAEQRRKQEIAAAEKTLQEENALLLSEIDLLEATEDEKTRLRLEAEKKRLEGVLRINEEFGKQMSDLQIQQIKNQIALADQELAKLTQDQSRPDIYEALGLKVTEDDKIRIAESLQLIKDSFSSLIQTRIDATNAAVERSNQALEQARAELEEQIALQEAGEEADIQGAVRTLNEKKRINQKAIAEQRKAQRAQQRIQEAESISSIITASANIFKGWSTIPFVGQILGAAAVAAMITAFIAAKVQARRVSRFGDGGDFDIKGGSHSSGNDVSLGVHNGVEMKAEGGEKAAIFSRKSVRKYGRGRISDIVKSLNKGDFQTKYSGAFNQSDSMLAIVAQSKGADTRELLEENARLREELKETVKSIPQPIQQWDDKGYRRHIRTKTTVELNVKERNSY